MNKGTYPSRRIFLALDYFFFLLIILVCLYPFWYIFISSVSGSSGDAGAFLPRSFTLENYSKVMGMEGVFNALVISILRTLVGTALTVISAMFLGYLFTKEKMPFRKFLYRALMITMYVSGGLVPTYLAIRHYGLLDNFWVYILPSMVSAYYIILVKTFVEQLPSSVEESAMLDGAGTLTIFFRIIIPMSMPIVATIAVFSGVGHWNSWFDNHLYTFRSRNLTTLQYMLYNYLNQVEILVKQMNELGRDMGIDKIITPKGVRMTVTMVTVTPVLFIYPFLQRYFVKGIMLGAVKG
ncbi:MAG: carbohydrate ABC transporter permease [Treponema sp.]|jgi:ABC-type glycerol-3-phosphate transport system permease component|nr:carbohydrate ABC transporter permease [Treponema sp.]